MTYVYTDPQGTPLAEANASGTITARFDYAPYGQSVTSMGAAPNGPGYTGHVNDPDTGLVYMQARYYDPEVGRFLSVDPVAPSTSKLFNFSRYDYADNNPVGMADIDGRYTCDRKNDATFCGEVDKYVSHLRESLHSSALKPSERKLIAGVLAHIGKKDVGGPNYISGFLRGDKQVAATDQRGTTTIDVRKLTGKDSMDTAAQAIGHEAQHDIDTEQWGEASDEKAFRRTETNAYTTQAAIEMGFGMRLLSSDMAAAIESSVQLDLHQVGQRPDSANKMKDNEKN